jgi:flagellar assembly factor FliW
MRVSGTRFGEIELDDAKTIVFAAGLVGFPEARRYVLLDSPEAGQIAWLQSLDIPALAFPVVDGAAIDRSYPQPGAAELAHEAGFGDRELAVLVIVAAPRGKGLFANLLAPLVVGLTSRRGAQIVLDPRRYAAAVPLVLTRTEAPAIPTSA